MDKEKSGPKWDSVAPDDKGRGKLAGRGKSAGGKEKGEAQRLKRSEIQRARQTMSDMTPAQVMGMIGVTKGQLTAKQKAFAYNVAMGNTRAEAYRMAYKRDATKHTLKSKPYELVRDERIKREIEAYQLAQEAAKHRTAEDLRSLVIQVLVQQVIDPDCPPAVRTQAAKTLGNVTEVAAFTERRESVVHHSSDAIRNKIMGELQTLMSGKTVEGEIVAQDAASLLQELASSSTQDFTQDSTLERGPSLHAQDSPGTTPTDTAKDTPSA